MKLHEALLDKDVREGRKYIERDGHCGVSYVKQWRLVMRPARGFHGPWMDCESRTAFDGDDFSGPTDILGKPHDPWKPGTFEHYDVNCEVRLVDA